MWAGSRPHEIHTNPHPNPHPQIFASVRVGPCSGLVGFVAMGWGRGGGVGPICSICDCLVWMGCVDDGWCVWVWVGFVIVVGFFNNNNDGCAGSRQVWHGLCRGGPPFLHGLRVAGGGVTNILLHGLPRTPFQFCLFIRKQLVDKIRHGEHLCRNNVYVSPIPVIG